MNSKEELNQAITVGIQAQELLNNKLLSSLILSKKNHACEMFMRTNRGADKERTELWHSVQGVISFEQELQQLVDNGNIAKNLLMEQDQSISANVHSPFKSK